MHWQVTNLDIDGTIPAQTRLAGFMEARVNLRSHQNNLRLWPDKRGLHAARQAIKKLRADSAASQLVFYGSGDLNQLSAILLENLPESCRPLTVVLFDNHPDWFDLPPAYHCGNWLATALKNEWIEEAILIGQDSEDLQGHSFWFSPLRDLYSQRLRIFPYETERAFVPLKFIPDTGKIASAKSKFGSELFFETVSKLGIKRLAERLAQELGGRNVYIAVDKDVLSTDDAMTDWEQGRLRIPELLTLIESICGNANVVGADVCGERSPTALQGFFKRFDAGRLFQGLPSDLQEATEVNEKANLAIMNCILQNARQSSSSSSKPSKEAICLS